MAQDPRRIAQSIRILARFGVEQDARRFERRCAKHYNSAVLIVILLRDLIDDADSTRLTGVRIDENLSHDGVRAQSHFAGLRGGGMRRAGAAVIRVGRAAAVAMATVVAGGAALVGLGQDRHAPDDYVASREF